MSRLFTLPNPRRVLPVIVFTIIFLGSLFIFYDAGYAKSVTPGNLGGHYLGAGGGSPDHNDSHPIDDLIRDARLQFKQLLDKQSTTLEQAASQYRERRGRHPPPGFDAWFAAAQKSKALVEDLLGILLEIGRSPDRSATTHSVVWSPCWPCVWRVKTWGTRRLDSAV